MRNRQFSSLLLPGLFESLIGLEQPQLLRTLKRCLRGARLQHHTQPAYELALADLLGGAMPLAALSWPPHLGVRPDATLLCADPVHLLMAQDSLRLVGQGNLALEPQETSALIESLNAHFADRDIRFYAGTTTRWHVSIGHELKLDLYPPSQVYGRDITPFLPTGNGEHQRRYLSWLNELQMLLHTHPVNTARTANNQLPINSLWLWGGADAPPLDQLSGQAGNFYTDDSLCKTICHNLGQPTQDLPNALPLQAAPFVLVATEALERALYDSPSARRQCAQRLLECYVIPACEAVQAGELPGLYLDTCAGTRLALTRWSRGALWRTHRAFNRFVS